MPRRKQAEPAARGGLSALLAEKRLFPPPPAFRAQANCRDPKLRERAARNPEKFWAEWAAKLEWFKPWKKVLEWKAPHAKWFVGGKLNLSVNCLDRHVRSFDSAQGKQGPMSRRNKAALVWEGEPGDRRTLTY
ncbi:MAG: acetyl-coenzyme A synthetase N-terminal domain-containing protein, partial [Candidatus Acidiferrales bacterium]